MNFIKFYNHFKSWYNVNGRNPYYWKLIWFSIFEAKPWDMFYIYELLQIQIKKSNYYFKNVKTYINEDHKNLIIKWQNIAINLLDIILDKKELHTVDNKLYTEDIQYNCLVNVNTKNVKRFAVNGYDFAINKIIPCYKYMEEYPHELYIEKARRLLFKILNLHSSEWWD